MSIRLRTTSKNKREREEERDIRDEEAREANPPTVAERIKATRIMGLIGAALMAGFLLTIGYSIYENSKTIPVDGEVVGIGANGNSSTRTNGYKEAITYNHTFRFTDQDGVEHVASAVGRGRDSSYNTGDIVSIGYYPDDFTKVRIQSWFGLWKVQLTLFGLGLVLIIYSFWGVKQIRNEEVTDQYADSPLVETRHRQ